MMQNLFKLKSNLFALFLFLPITPSIAAITVFSKSVLIDRHHEASNLPQNTSLINYESQN